MEFFEKKSTMNILKSIAYFSVFFLAFSAFSEENTADSSSQPPPKPETLPQAPKEEVKETAKVETKQEAPKSEPTHVEGEGLLGPIRIGPSVGFGILQGPNFNLDAKIFKYIGLGFSFGGFHDLDLLKVSAIRGAANGVNSDFQINTLSLSNQQMEGKLSVYPFGKTFFIGVAAGLRTIVIESNATVSATEQGVLLTAPVFLQYQIQSTYVTPQIGWFATWDGPYGGLSLGTEFGAQFALATTTILNGSVEGNNTGIINSGIQNWQSYQNLKSQLNSQVVSAIQNYPLPYWNILKVGWMF